VEAGAYGGDQRGAAVRGTGHAERHNPGIEWIPERRLRRERADARDDRHTRLPDGVLLLGKWRVAIEVELHHKSRRATEAVLYSHAREYDGTIYYCARDAIGQLRRLAESGRFSKLDVRELWKLGAEA
jgi:hypothetical protein